MQIRCTLIENNDNVSDFVLNRLQDEWCQLHQCSKETSKSNTCLITSSIWPAPSLFSSVGMSLS